MVRPGTAALLIVGDWVVDDDEFGVAGGEVDGGGGDDAGADACADADDVHNLLLGGVVGDGEDFDLLAFCHLDGAGVEEIGGGEVVGVEAPALGGDVVVEVFVLEGRPCEGSIL